MAGRGFGKTRAGAEWVIGLAVTSARRSRSRWSAASIGEAREIMVEGVSGLLSVARRPAAALGWEPSDGRLHLAERQRGAAVFGRHADGLRGPEHDFAWCDELAKWREARRGVGQSAAGAAAGPRPRALVTTTPRPIELLERIAEEPGP